MTTTCKFAKTATENIIDAYTHIGHLAMGWWYDNATIDNT